MACRPTARRAARWSITSATNIYTEVGQRRRMSERGRTEWLLSLKANRPCTDCGRMYPPQVMQWDHVPGTLKLGNISTDFGGRSREDILKEIAKFELVCANCHTIRTFQRAGWGSWSSDTEEAGAMGAPVCTLA